MFTDMALSDQLQVGSQPTGSGRASHTPCPMNTRGRGGKFPECDLQKPLLAPTPAPPGFAAHSAPASSCHVGTENTDAIPTP